MDLIPGDMFDFAFYCLSFGFWVRIKMDWAQHETIIANVYTKCMEWIEIYVPLTDAAPIFHLLFFGIRMQNCVQSKSIETTIINVEEGEMLRTEQHKNDKKFNPQLAVFRFFHLVPQSQVTHTINGATAPNAIASHKSSSNPLIYSHGAFYCSVCDGCRQQPEQTNKMKWN